MSELIAFLKGRKTYFVLAAAIIAALPEFAESLPDGTSFFAAVGPFIGKFWPLVAAMTVKAGLNRAANGG